MATCGHDSENIYNTLYSIEWKFNTRLGERINFFTCYNMITLKLQPTKWVKVKVQTYQLYSVPGGKVNILGGRILGHSKQKCLYEHVYYSERFPR